MQTSLEASFSYHDYVFTNSFYKVKTKLMISNNNYVNYNYNRGKVTFAQLYKQYKVFRDEIKLKTQNKKKKNAENTEKGKTNFLKE